MDKELYFTKPTTLRELIAEYPSVLDRYVAVPADNGMLNILGAEGIDGNPIVYLSTHCDYSESDENPKETRVVVFHTE